MAAITVLTSVPVLGYVTFYSGGNRFTTGLGFPTEKYPVWDARHLDKDAKRALFKSVCNGRGGVDDLEKLQETLVAFGCVLWR